MAVVQHDESESKATATQINQCEPYSRLCQRSKSHLQQSCNLKIPSDSNLEALRQPGYIDKLLTTKDQQYEGQVQKQTDMVS